MSNPAFVASVLIGPVLVNGLSVLEFNRVRRLNRPSAPVVSTEDGPGHDGLKQGVQPAE
jgi:hypothetical protein